MSNLHDLRYAVPLTAEDVMPETDMIPVYHPSGGVSTDRSISLASLAAAVGGGEGGEFAGVSRAEFDAFKAAVISDLNALRDAICLSNASLDADTGVATDTYAANGNPPPITAV